MLEIEPILCKSIVKKGHFTLGLSSQTNSISTSKQHYKLYEMLIVGYNGKVDEKIDDLVKKLATTITDDTMFNPYNEMSKATDGRTAPGLRQQNIRLYLKAHANLKTKVMWIYLSPSFTEAKRSGVPMINSEKFYMLENALDTNKRFEKATKTKKKTPSSAMSSILWDVANTLEINPLIWPVIPFYTHKKGARTKPRKPSANDLGLYSEFLRELVRIFKPKVILGIGKEAQNALQHIGIQSTYIAHPRTGKKAFVAKAKRLAA